MKTYRNLVYTGANKRKSPFDLFLADNDSLFDSESDVEQEKPLVIFIHGYKGFKDWGAWDLVGKAFAENNFDFLKLNLSHNGGTPEDPIDFPDLEAFSENTYSRELEDLHHITNLALSGIDTGEETRSWKKIALIGHSRGGGIAILHAAQNPAVSHLVTWASVADFGERFNFDLEEWKKTGVTTVKNARTKQDMPHKYSFYTDYQDNVASLNIEAAAKKIGIPWLIIHGGADEAVPVENAERLKAWNPHAELLTIAGTGHTFGSSHPWTEESLPPKLAQITNDSIRFFDVVLS